MSLMNGLSSLGQGVAAFAGQAGLEQQKADLAQQQTKLADQLATTRETTLQQGQQTFQAGQNDLTRQAQADLENTRLAAVAKEGAANRAAEMERELARINAPPDVVKVLRSFGMMPDQTGAASPQAPAATPQPASDSAMSAPQSSGSSASPSAASSVTGTTSAPTGPDLSNPIVAKALGQPMPGSEDAIRRGIAQDVNGDPAFKYKTVGQKAAEIESRLAVASGKMTDPNSRESMAQAIANYQIAPLTNFALTKSGGPETMARVIEINPDYQEGRYPEVADAMKKFGAGKEGGIIRSVNNAVQHLGVMDQATDALNNNDLTAFNSVMNAAKKQFGVAAPNTFEGLKQIVGTEVEKAVAGGIGSDADRKRIMDSLSSANSPEQLKAMVDGFRSLMAGQVNGLKAQYEDATGFTSGPFAFEKKLMPATLKALKLGSDDGATVDNTSGFDQTQQPAAATPPHPPLPSGFRIVQ